MSAFLDTLYSTIKGVQKHIRDKAPLAYYIHCHGHSLNLVLVASSKAVPEADDFSVS